MNKENQEWEKRFEKTFPNTYYNESKNSVYEKRLSGCKKELKSFIRTELSKAREEERRKIKKILESLIQDEDSLKPLDFILGNNKALIDAIKEIEK